jgi:preprotein translocase subunit SecD
VKFGHPGSSATVNSDGTGLAIKVAGVTSASEANSIVAKLDFRGSVYYRPVLAGPLPPAAGETPSSQTATQLGVPAGTDLSTVKGYDTPTSAASSMGPTQAAVIPDVEYGTTNVIVRWQVGPSQLDGTSTENTKVTKLDGANAVQIVFANTSKGLGAFNTLTKSCFDKTTTCPTGIYAVQFDSQIAYASQPRPGDATFTPFTQQDVIVASPTWTEEEALILAVALEAGALPVALTPA